jgi:predicted Zn-dependent protease DUF2268
VDDQPRALADPAAPVSQSRRAIAAFLASLALACSDATAPTPNVADDPRDAQFVTDDIGRFWQAYDVYAQSRNSSAFQLEYLDKASAGLRDFIQARNLTAVSLVQMVNALPQYFAAVRANTLRLANGAEVLGRIRANYEHIEALYPASVYPPVTFLIGRFSTAGTVRQSGMLIGTEFFAIDDATPLQELNDFQRANVSALDSIPLVVAHEHAHVLQRFGKIVGKFNPTLLEQSLLEGGADFIGELASGSHINKHIHEYGLQHEAELWAEFRQEMNGTDISKWLYNQGTSTTRPGDLGYFIGYRITQAYYDKASDKIAALRDIIEMKNASDFLAASGYSPS